MSKRQEQLTFYAISMIYVYCMAFYEIGLSEFTVWDRGGGKLATVRAALADTPRHARGCIGHQISLLWPEAWAAENVSGQMSKLVHQMHQQYMGRWI